MYRRLKIRLSAALMLASAACGGGGTSPSPPGPPPPPPPAPVASVTVTPNTATLLPIQTQPLTAATLDGAGNPLSGRTVTWNTDAAGVATVSSAGLVTAVGAGSATITATSEGKTGSSVITVNDGAQVPTTGGTVNAAGGNVRIVVPGGATATALAVTVTPNPTPPPLPDPFFPVAGTSFTFGPEGTNFTAPVTVTMKYDPAKLPVWALPSDLQLYHFTAGDWQLLPNLTVDPVAHTVSAQTTSFSPFTVGINLPQATLTPSPGSVNLHQRSVVFTASIPGHATAGLTFAWITTGLNGAVSPLIGADAQYTMTQASLPPGDLDAVQVIIRGNIDPTTPTVLVPLGQAEAIVNASLAFTYEINPDDSQVPFGGTKGLDAVLRDGQGAIYTPPGGLETLLVWTNTDITGTVDIANPNHKTNTTHGIYTARGAGTAPIKSPRIDQIHVDFYPGYMKSYTTVIQGRFGLAGRTNIDSIVKRFDIKQGSADAFVEVAPKIDISQFTVRTTPSGGGACVVAVANVAKHTGATSYTLDVTGIVGSPNGTTFHKVVTGPTNTGSILDVFDAGTFYGVPMDGGCAQSQPAITARQALYQSEFGPATFLTTIAP